MPTACVPMEVAHQKNMSHTLGAFCCQNEKILEDSMQENATARPSQGHSRS